LGYINQVTTSLLHQLGGLSLGGSSRDSSSTTSPTPRVRVPWHIARLITRLVVDYFASRRLVVNYFAYAARPGASAHRVARHAARRRLLRLRRASGCLGTSRGSSCGSSLTTLTTLRVWLLILHRASGYLGTSRGSSRDSSSTTSPRVLVPRHVARRITRLVVDYFASRRLVVDYFTYAARPGASAHRVARHTARRRLLRLRCASGCLSMWHGSSCGSSSTTSTTPRFWLLLLRRASGCFGTLRSLSRRSSPTRRLVVDYRTYTARTGASAHRATRHVARRRLLRLAQARRRLLRLRRTSGCLGTSRGSSRGSSSTTSPRAGSPSTTAPTPSNQVPRHVAQLVTRLVTRLVVDYFTSRRLVVDYCAYVARSGASARHTARHAARRRLLHLAQARRRPLRLRRTSGCLGTSRGWPRGSSSTTLPRLRVRVPRHVERLITRLVASLVVDYFACAARPRASARRAARHGTCRRLHRLRRASGCLGTSRGSSRGSLSTTSPRAGSSSTTSPTPHVRMPRHVARLVTRLVVDYFASAAHPDASARRAARHAARRRLLRLRRASECLDTSSGSSRGSSLTTSPTSLVRLLRHVVRLVT
jgi:hypothetical protein